MATKRGSPVRASSAELTRPEYEQLRDALARRSALWQRVLVPTAVLNGLRFTPAADVTFGLVFPLLVLL